MILPRPADDVCPFAVRTQVVTLVFANEFSTTFVGAMKAGVLRGKVCQTAFSSTVCTVVVGDLMGVFVAPQVEALPDALDCDGSTFFVGPDQVWIHIDDNVFGKLSEWSGLGDKDLGRRLDRIFDWLCLPPVNLLAPDLLEALTQTVHNVPLVNTKSDVVAGFHDDLAVCVTLLAEIEIEKGKCSLSPYNPIFIFIIPVVGFPPRFLEHRWEPGPFDIATLVVTRIATRNCFVSPITL